MKQPVRPLQAAHEFWKERTEEERYQTVAIALSVLIHLAVWGYSQGHFRWQDTPMFPSGYSVGLVQDIQNANKPSVKTAPVTAKKPDEKPVERIQKAKVEKKEPIKAKERTDLTKEKNTVPLAAKVRKKKVETQPSVAKDVPSPAKPKSSGTSSRLDSFLKQKKSQAKENQSSGVAGASGSGTGNMALGFYLSSLQRQIHSWWQVPSGMQQRNLAVRIELTISRSGELLGTKLIESSGSDLFDNSASTALRNAAPFDPLPNSIDDPLQLVVRLIPGELQ